VFDVYDFDADGEISREDVRIILSYIPQVSTAVREMERSFEPEDKIRKKMFESRIEAQEQIETLCDAVFKSESKTVNSKEFSDIVEGVCSDLFISILTVVRDCLPCTDTFWENMNDYYKKTDKGLSSPKRDVASAKFLTQFSPRANSKKKNMLQMAAESAAKNKGDSPKDEEESVLDFDENIESVAKGFQKNDEKLKEMEKRMNEPGSPVMHGDAVRLSNQTVFGKDGSSMLRAAATETTKTRKERFSSPTRILSGDQEDDLEGEDKVITHSGQMHRESGERKLKGYWYKLRNRDLYYYKKESDEKYKGMYALTNVFIREEEPEPYDEDNFVYSFTLIFVSKERRFY
jgi:hypothetical protein